MINVDLHVVFFGTEWLWDRNLCQHFIVPHQHWQRKTKGIQVGPLGPLHCMSNNPMSSGLQIISMLIILYQRSLLNVHLSFQPSASLCVFWTSNLQSSYLRDYPVIMGSAGEQGCWSFKLTFLRWIGSEGFCLLCIICILPVSPTAWLLTYYLLVVVQWSLFWSPRVVCFQHFQGSFWVYHVLFSKQDDTVIFLSTKPVSSLPQNQPHEGSFQVGINAPQLLLVLCQTHHKLKIS